MATTDRSEYWKKRWRERDVEKWRADRRQWYRLHKEEAYAATRDWVMKNPDKTRATQKKYRHNLRKRVLEKLGNRCSNPACQWVNQDGSVGCIDTRCLQVDHVNGGGTKENLQLSSRTRLYWKVLEDTTNTYQLLCANCNWIKRCENGEF